MTDTFQLSPQTLDRYRNYLRLMAKAQIAPKIRRRVEPSDIVQETLFEAFQHREQFQGQSEGELIQWLRHILRHNILDATRAMRRQKRDVARECAVGALRDDSAAELADQLAADLTSPSEHAVKTEQILELAAAISKLPSDQQDAVVLHHLQGKTLAEVANLLDRSTSATAGLLYRGLKRLRVSMAKSDE